jgi:hypothetical protein
MCRKVFGKGEEEEYRFRFKMTIVCGFLENMLRVREPSMDEKQ